MNSEKQEEMQKKGGRRARQEDRGEARLQEESPGEEPETTCISPHRSKEEIKRMETEGRRQS